MKFLAAFAALVAVAAAAPANVAESFLRPVGLAPVLAPEVPAPAFGADASGNPLVQIIVNVKSQESVVPGAVAEVPAPVPSPAVVPEPVLVVEQPSPAVVPEPIVIAPAPAPVVVPEPIVIAPAPAPIVIPEANPIDVIAVSAPEGNPIDLLQPAPVGPLV